MPSLSEAPAGFGKPIESGGSFEPVVEINRFDPERMWNIAETMVDFSLDIQKEDRLLIEYHPGGRQLVEMIGYLAAQRGAAVLPRIEDASVNAAVLAGVQKNETDRIYDEMVGPYYADIGWATKVARVGSVDFPHAMDIVEGKAKGEYAKAFEPRLNTRVDRRRWCLIYLPTTAEAEIDGMEYEEYVNTFLEASARPWGQVEEAQDFLIDTLKKGEVLEFFADENNLDERWRTHVKMSIKGMIFANSTIRINFPGSEVFSSPVRGTIEGNFGVPYPVMFGGKMLPNIGFVFEKGRIVEHFTAGDSQWVDEVLNTDEGAREIGEVAFGTNPVFDRPYLNGLYVEKVGGSFHLAAGKAYPYTEYANRPVVLDNGVRSAYHEDLTRMMLPEYGGGRAVLDGQIIQENGVFIDERLGVLNPSP